MKSLLSMFQFVIGCHHRQRSSVFTIKRRTYQVCLKCGREFEYSWALMHCVRSSAAGSPPVPLSSNCVRINDVRPNEAPLFDPVGAQAWRR